MATSSGSIEINSQEPDSEGKFLRRRDLSRFADTSTPVRRRIRTALPCGEGNCGAGNKPQKRRAVARGKMIAFPVRRACRGLPEYWESRNSEKAARFRL